MSDCYIFTEIWSLSTTKTMLSEKIISDFFYFLCSFFLACLTLYVTNIIFCKYMFVTCTFWPQQTIQYPLLANVKIKVSIFLTSRLHILIYVPSYSLKADLKISQLWKIWKVSKPQIFFLEQIILKTFYTVLLVSVYEKEILYYAYYIISRKPLAFQLFSDEGWWVRFLVKAFLFYTAMFNWYIKPCFL